MTTPNRTEQLVTPEVFRLLAQAWSHKDDWNLDSISLGVLGDLLGHVEAGDDPGALAEHASHVMDDCVEARCDLSIPDCITKDVGYGERLKARIEAIGHEGSFDVCPACRTRLGRTYTS